MGAPSTGCGLWQSTHATPARSCGDEFHWFMWALGGTSYRGLSSILVSHCHGGRGKSRIGTAEGDSSRRGAAPSGLDRGRTCNETQTGSQVDVGGRSPRTCASRHGTCNSFRAILPQDCVIREGATVRLPPLLAVPVGLGTRSRARVKLPPRPPMASPAARRNGPDGNSCSQLPDEREPRFSTFRSKSTASLVGLRGHRGTGGIFPLAPAESSLDRRYYQRRESEN